MSGIKLPNGMELRFAPGCFDNFEGTQEELDELINEISAKFSSGEALQEATPIDTDEFLDSLSIEELESIISELDPEFSPKRLLQ